MRKLKKLLIPVMILAAAAVCIVYAGQPEEKMTESVSIRNVASVVEVSGKIYGSEEIVYYSEISARVSHADYDTGDVVRKDDILVQYDLSDLENTLSDAMYYLEYCRNGYEAAAAENEKYTEKYNTAVLLDESCKSQYEDAISRMNELDLTQYCENIEIQSRYEEIYLRLLDLNRQIAEKTTELSNNQLKMTLASFEGSSWSMKFLENQGELLQNELAELNIEAIALEMEITQLPDAQMNSEEYALYLELTRLLEDISRDWSEAKTDKAAADAVILNDNALEQLKNSWQMAVLNTDIAQEELETGQNGVVSECSGVISQKYVQDGAYVAKGSPLYAVQNTEQLKVTVEISKYDIEDIAEGQRAVIAVGSTEYEGVVEKINRYATVDSSDNSKVKVDIHIDSPDENMILGLETDVSIYTGEAEGVPAIPVEALYTDDNGAYCYVVSEGIVEKRYITIGITGSKFAEAVEGVAEGEHVITDAVTDAYIGEKINENFN